MHTVFTTPKIIVIIYILFNCDILRCSAEIKQRLLTHTHTLTHPTQLLIVKSAGSICDLNRDWFSGRFHSLPIFGWVVSLLYSQNKCLPACELLLLLFVSNFSISYLLAHQHVLTYFNSIKQIVHFFRTFFSYYQIAIVIIIVRLHCFFFWIEHMVNEQCT